MILLNNQLRQTEERESFLSASITTQIVNLTDLKNKEYLDLFH